MSKISDYFYYSINGLDNKIANNTSKKIAKINYGYSRHNSTHYKKFSPEKRRERINYNNKQRSELNRQLARESAISQVRN